MKSTGDCPYKPCFGQRQYANGVYLNLVEGLLWVQDVEGSNPFTPTTLLERSPMGMLAAVLAGPEFACYPVADGLELARTDPRNEFRTKKFAPIPILLVHVPY